MNGHEPPAADLVTALSRPSAYPNETTTRIELIETHISWVFLTDSHAYKVKKPVRNAFLDYSTPALRHHYCLEELRLDRRYAPELYLSVVPITHDHEQIIVDGTGVACEYAVKMQRFPAEDLLVRRLEENLVQPGDIERLAQRIAEFHTSAARVDSQVVAKSRGTDADSAEQWGTAVSIESDATENFDALKQAPNLSNTDREHLQTLASWTQQRFSDHRGLFDHRRQTGFVRECHGDLHAGNVVQWNGQLTPFDGIEFSARFRWIDVLSDLAFLAMDLDLRRHDQLANVLVNAYLEQTGDYDCLELLNWYRVYRAMVRAKIAGIVMSQHEPTSPQYVTANRERTQLLTAALQYTRMPSPKLWITHGLSGSGKSTGAAEVVRSQGAIRVRADVERKRLFGETADYRPNSQAVQRLYSSEMSQRTYQRLLELADKLLHNGFSVVVDATFLKREQRALFARLGEKRSVPFSILNFQADRPTLEQRLLDRQQVGSDASDADRDVLEMQVAALEPLSDWELAHSQPGL